MRNNPSKKGKSQASLSHATPLESVVAILSPQLPEQYKLKCKRMLLSLGAEIVCMEASQSEKHTEASQSENRSELSTITHVITLPSGTGQFQYIESNEGGTASYSKFDPSAIHIPVVSHFVTPLWVFHSYAKNSRVSEVHHSANPFHMFSSLKFKFAQNQVNANEQNLLVELIEHYGGEVVDSLSSSCTHLLVMRDEGDECVEAAKLRTSADYDVYGVRLSVTSTERSLLANEHQEEHHRYSSSDEDDNNMQLLSPFAKSYGVQIAATPQKPPSPLSVLKGQPFSSNEQASKQVNNENSAVAHPKQVGSSNSQGSQRQGGKHFDLLRMEEARASSSKKNHPRFSSEQEMMARKEYLTLDDAVITLSYAWVHACIATRDYLPEADFEFESYSSSVRTLPKRQAVALFKSPTLRAEGLDSAKQSLSPVSMFPGKYPSPRDCPSGSLSRTPRKLSSSTSWYFQAVPRGPLSTVLRNHVIRFCDGIHPERLKRAKEMVWHLGGMVVGEDLKEANILSVVANKELRTPSQPGELYFDPKTSRYLPVITIAVYDAGKVLEAAKRKKGIIASLGWLDALHAAFVSGQDQSGQLPLASTGPISERLRQSEVPKIKALIERRNTSRHDGLSAERATPMLFQLFPAMASQFADAANGTPETVNPLLLLGNRQRGYCEPPHLPLTGSGNGPTSPQTAYLDLLWYPQPRLATNQRGMHDVVVSVTGFSSSTCPSRTVLRLVVEACGGCCLGPMSRERTTHLVCRETSPGGLKYSRAKHWKIKIVNALWPLECLRQQTKAEEGLFSNVRRKLEAGLQSRKRLLFHEDAELQRVNKSQRVSNQRSILARRELGEDLASPAPLSERIDDANVSGSKYNVSDALSTLDLRTEESKLSTAVQRINTKRQREVHSAETPASRVQKRSCHVNESDKLRLTADSPNRGKELFSPDSTSRVFVLCSTSDQDLVRWRQIILHLGGIVREDFETEKESKNGVEPDYAAAMEVSTPLDSDLGVKFTHLVVSQVQNTEKFSSALAAGKWILPGEYLEACLESQRFLDESRFLNKLPEFPDEFGTNVASAVLHWRSQGGRAFENRHFVILGSHDTERRSTRSSKTSDMESAAIHRVLRAGGGEATIVPRSIHGILDKSSNYLGLLLSKLKLRHGHKQTIMMIVPKEIYLQVSMVQVTRRSSRKRTQSKTRTQTMLPNTTPSSHRLPFSAATRMKQLILSNKVDMTTFEKLFLELMSPAS